MNNNSIQIRIKILEMIHQSKSSHIASCYSIVDILEYLYSGHLNVDCSKPLKTDRDRLIISKGHAAAAVYATLGYYNFFDQKELDLYAKNSSIFMSHVSDKVPGVEFATGSLGHGLPFGVGKALWAKRNKENWKVFVLLSDGELNEGSNWEAIMFASHHKLSNLNIIIDSNKLQSLDTTENTIDMIDLNSKFSAFGCEVTEFNGNNHDEINKAFTSKKHTNMPQVYIANTIKGKGVDFMENTVAWHYKSPSKDEYEKALDILLCAMNT